MTAPRTAAPAFDRERFLRQLLQLDAALAKAGIPALSPFWRAEVSRFVRSGCQRWTVRAGRRSGKSLTACKLAIAQAMTGPWRVPAGDDAVLAFVSVSRDESAARLRTIATMLGALGVAHEQRNDELEMTFDAGTGQPARRVIFKTFAASVRAVVGFTSIMIVGDEVALWESRDSAANPAREIAASLRPTLATMTFPIELWISSPWSTDDFHAELFEAGNTREQCVSYAPTWAANPTISEARTHELEPDDRAWSRAYLGIPGGILSSAFDPEDVAACFVPPPPERLRARWIVIDASSLRGDTFALAEGGLAEDDSIIMTGAHGWDARAQRSVSMADIVKDIATRAKALGTRDVFGDQREEASLRAMLADHGVTLKSYAWSEPSKEDALQLLRRMMRERRVILPDHRQLRSELIGMKARLLPSGKTRYESGGLDYASCLITLAHAINARELRGPLELRPHVPTRKELERRFLSPPGQRRVKGYY